MNDPVDWSVTSWEGSRRQQHREYLALPFRQKLEILEQMAEWGRLGRGKAIEVPPGRPPSARQES